ncbi:uncharacterized protein si:ch73-204p21.2 [Centropristis striata]|uniref:uncharacterized protein si:ch73-204p21.2 n=1 Tax=Centropristis striata TaxID=184440 RepID=UPI0027DF5503|nr:uncharacterized protein si:ch73-204p21.2 [Centropristis striata]XP_059213787.1 uncharacterized protein si:ch73-204p21.2 [Centropristis striata]XP_059213795.1 uncharacterized protein si:ch73-204p21.2 [Centropristis striata]
MAALGAEVAGSWVLTSGVVSFFIVLVLLSIFLTALCSECSRRSFELRDPDTGKDPSALIRVVKLEEVARENPMINEIQNDEKDVQTNGSPAVKQTADRDSELAAESNPDEETSPVSFTPWRSHLGAPQSNPDVDSSALDHIYHTIGGGGGGGGRGNGNMSSPPTNQEPAGAHSAGAGDSTDRNSVYARVSKKTRPAPPPYPAPAPEQLQVQQEEEESSPPLPRRRTPV